MSCDVYFLEAGGVETQKPSSVVGLDVICFTANVLRGKPEGAGRLRFGDSSMRPNDASGGRGQ